MRAEIARLKAENEEFKKRQMQRPPLTFVISENKAVSIIGLGKKPQTLYKAQWEKILNKSDELKAFMEANAEELR